MGVRRWELARIAAGAGTALLIAGWTQLARGQVSQVDTDATPLPQPVSAAERNLVTDSWGYRRDTLVSYDADGNDISEEGLTFGDFYPSFEDGDAITLAGLFKWRGEGIDAVADASVGPGYFEPTCGFRVELMLRGGDCALALGWYNIDEIDGTDPPEPEEIFEIVPSNVPALMSCQGPLDNGFCPLGWDNIDPRNQARQMWLPEVFGAEDLTEDSRYAGGYVGFVLIGDPTQGCSVNKHSLPSHNQENTNGQPWVTVLRYSSTLDQNGFFLAFEDLPMSEEDWTETGTPGNLATNEGDFNDFVFYVSGDGCDLCLGDCDERDPPPGAGGTGAGGSLGDAGASGEVTATTGSGGATQASTAAAPSTSASGTSAGDGGTGGSSGSNTGGSSAGGTGAGGTGAGGTGAGGSSGGDGAAATGGTSSAECVPGRQLECSCVDGAQGAQVCNEDGDGYSACECSGAPAGASGDDGGCGCRLTSAAAVPDARLGLLLLTGLAATVRRRGRRLLPACEGKREFEGRAAR